MGKNNDSLFDWLVRRAEADLGVAQALAACEAQRTDQIKQLETALVGQISKLQCQVIESGEAELMDLKSEISACAERIARFESTESTANAAKHAVQELEDLSEKLTARQTELEGRHSGLEKLTEALGHDIRALQQDLKDKVDGIKSVQAETRHFQSEARSLADRIAQAESVTWQFRTLALRNAEQLEQTTGSLNSEIASLNTSVAELNKTQRELRLPNLLLQELGTKIEEIQERLVQTQNGQTERDVRLGHLDSGLCTLAERMTQIEEVAGRNHALIQAEMNSAAGFRNRTSQELSAIETRLNDPAIRQNLQELELTLSAKIQQSQHQAAQKFMLLETREADREKKMQELSAALGARFAEHEARTDEKLRIFGNDHEELCRVEPEIQKLAERILAVNSAIHRTQAQADASAGGLARLEKQLSSEMTGLRAEIGKIVEQQQAFRPAHDDLCEIERKLGGALQDIQRQVAIEREGLDHWAKGLRESFAAELIGVQARLSERLSQIEHRYTGLERSHEAVETSIAGLQTQLQTKLQSQRDEDQSSRKVAEDLTLLAERMSHFERGAAQAEERTAAFTRDIEQHVGALQHEIRMLASSLDQRELSSFDSIVRSLEEKLGARLDEIEERFTNRLSHYNQDASDRMRQSEETASRAQKELASLRTALEAQNTASSALASSPALNEVLCTKISELEQRLAAQFNLIENRDAERAQHFRTISERLESELATLKTNFNQGAEASYASSMPVLRESVDKQMQHLQQHFEAKLILIEKRVEQTANAFITESAALRAELTNLRGASAPVAPVVLDLEDKLSAKIEELRNHMGERFSAFDRREAEIKDLAERAQTLMHRLPDRSAQIPSLHNTPVGALQTLAPRVEANGERAGSGSIKAEESPGELQARSEKEQLIKLQERMSAEIERVRAELKERSGRWKVRKTAS